MALEILERLKSSGKLPTPPGVVLKILELTRKSEVSAREMAAAISLDPGLSAKILRFVNSPLTGVSREVTSLQQAVALMGTRGVKMMALSFSMLGTPGSNTCAGFDQEHFSIHSLGCGVAAKILAAMARQGSPHDAFSIGLLSQIGRLMLASSLPREYAAVMADVGRVPQDLPPREIAVLGANYAMVGAEILRHWGIPAAMTDAIRAFRDDDMLPQAPPMVQLLHVAERAANAICPHGAPDPDDTRRFIEFAKKLLGFTEDQCVAALRDSAAEIHEARKQLDVSKGSLRSTEEIENEVRERIAELSMAMHLESQAMAVQQEDLLRRAITDPLTGIGNRAAFDARLSQELQRSARSGAPLALLMIDVDKFKGLNDSLGHLAGDRVLQGVARVLDDNLRKVDYVARYGGEEFAVIAPGTAEEGAILLAERLRAGVESLRVPWEGKSVAATVSVGVAVARDVVDESDGVKLIMAADAQLYAAKCAGRNRISVAESRTVAGRAG